MMLHTAADKPVDSELVSKYFQSLVNHFFKILPIRESGESSLPTYMRSLQVELLGFQDFIPEQRNNPDFLRLLSILQFLIDHPDCELPEVKREVFRAITLCNRLHDTSEKGGVKQ